MQSPSSVAAGDPPYAIDVLDEEPRPVPPDGRLIVELPPEPLLVRFDPGKLPGYVPLDKHALYGFQGLDMAVVADQTGVAAMREVASQQRCK